MQQAHMMRLSPMRADDASLALIVSRTAKSELSEVWRPTYRTLLCLHEELEKARSRLYHRQISQLVAHLQALVEIYAMHTKPQMLIKNNF